MKSKTTILLALVAVMVVATHAAFASDKNDTKGIFTLDQIDEARAKALQDKKPLAFIYSSLAITCPRSWAGTREHIKDLKYKTVVVIGMDHAKIPKVVNDAIDACMKSSNGMALPVSFITDMECKEVLCLIDNREDSKKEKPKAFRKISEYRKSLDSPAKKDPAPPVK